MTYKAWVGAEFPPRRWQSEAFTPARRSIVSGEWGVVHACTGSGKSRLIAELVAWALASGARVMVTTPSQDLVRQLWKTIADRVGARQVGQVYTARQEPFRPVAVVCHDSMATYAAALAQVGAKADLWIADEAHKTERPSVKEAIEVLTPRRRVGVTATPFRSSPGESLSLFRELVYSYTVGDALRDKVLVPPVVHYWHDEEITDVNDVVVQMIRRENVQGPGVISAASIADAESFAERLTAEGIPARAIHSRLSAACRLERVKWLRESTANRRALVHPSLLAEGVDMPWLMWGALRRRVGSRVRFVQEVGRYLRTHPGKTHADILDPYALFTLHSISNPAALGEPAEDPKLVKEMLEEDPFPLIDLPPLAVLPPAVAVDATGAWARALLMLMEAEGHYTPHPEYGAKDARWRRKRASDKQIAALGKLAWAVRVIPEPHKTSMKAIAKHPHRLRAGVAGDLISVLHAVADASADHRKARMKWPWPDTVVVPELPKRVVRGLM